MRSNHSRVAVLSHNYQQNFRQGPGESLFKAVNSGLLTKEFFSHARSQYRIKLWALKPDCLYAGPAMCHPKQIIYPLYVSGSSSSKEE